MPSSISHGPAGQIVSALMHLRNAARRAADESSRQANPPPATPEPAESAVRFDLSGQEVRQAEQAARDRAPVAVPANGTPAPVTPAAKVAAASPLPEARNAVTSAKAASAYPAAPSASALSASPATMVPAGVQLATSSSAPEAGVIPDDEAAARAWAIQSLSHENRLGLIDRIAGMADRPEAAEPAAPVPGAEANEPRTLARA
ncbi:hypothetical protein [Paracoccus sp. (in: a-proteobacteria)]|uniref:hypothetical protein n=1 Tax=Paracoccus sp. TaxID=267 RepID=UPI0026E0AA65|nr:hypothetical protein [Paracoccus sp. (in: a-proteobacteria)]MDO5368822.1 hypothetical protein [Paracoccus sp. (in: a-proteobacteria)]